MTLLALLWHLLAFIAPALVLAAGLWLAPRLRRNARPARCSAHAEALTLAGAGVLVLLAGLIFFGRDGKMATYTALVLVQGTLAWWLRGN
ncbi:hypothetical protein [Hydrogenophaga sp.]|uniref:hypothetical protein n=1 Tax=Hydrogenophaga sp. TaxID=1904254 RepID=UPI001983F2B3|nr:hypothetical protein [Hydrogenophaga sp.]MBD3893967.1 hypothetical protein [Hydrogenophaga sp.]